MQAVEPSNVFTEQEIIKHEDNVNKDGVIEDVADALFQAAKETDDSVKQQLGIDDDKIKLAFKTNKLSFQIHYK